MQLFVASCFDLTLRVFTEHFKLLDTVPVANSVLSLAFNEATSELYTGGMGEWLMYACMYVWDFVAVESLLYTKILINLYKKTFFIFTFSFFLTCISYHVLH